MNAGELKEWLTTVPDDARIKGSMADELSDPDARYICDPIYDPVKRQITFVLG